jgi:Tol biopolymer transport system component
MRSHSLPKLGSALAGVLLVAAACGGTTPTKSPGAAATTAPTAAGSTATAGVPAATIASTVAPTLAATVQGVKNGRIAYGLRSKAGTFNIFARQPDGSDEIQLTTGPANSLCAAYSPDGTQLAYCSDSSGDFEIWTMHADGSGQRQVTHLKGRVLFPDISPDGKHIVFAGVVGQDANTDVYVVDAADGGHLKALTTCNDAAAGCANDYPAWSPDGKQIVFIHQDDYVNEVGVNEQVWLMNADGTGKHALTTGADPKDQVPSWSPDGKRIVYASGSDENNGIWSVGIDGTLPVQLSGCLATDPKPCAGGSDFGPVWSPDGTRIAFLRAFQAVGSNDRPVYVMNADGTGQQRLAAGTALQAVPAWQALPG